MVQGMFFFSNFRNSNQNPIVFSPDDTSTSCAASDQLDKMRSIIDRDIVRLEESIRALKSRRNELSPIARLPTEILCRIFSLIEDHSKIYKSPKSWTSFSQVSQHWRSTALSAPELWTKITLSYPRRWVQEMLMRSKMAKLTIRPGSAVFEKSNPQGIKAIETVRLCLYEMNRVEELKLYSNLGFKMEEIFRDSKSVPHLHTLYIGCSSRSPFSIHEDFLYDTERLQHVLLINCTIGWNSRLLTCLTRLHLENSLKANSSVTQVLHALQRMPALTYLCLINSIPDDSEGPTTYPVVDLPCLQVLHISSGVAALTTVLHHITIPHSTSLILTCTEYESAQIDFSNFLSVLAMKFLPFFVIRSLALGVLPDNEIHGLVFCLSTSAIIQDGSFYSQPRIQLSFTWPSPLRFHSYVKALTSAFDAMSLSFLTQLQIINVNVFNSQTWVNTFGKLPLLNCVFVRGTALFSFLRALVYKTEAVKKSETAYHNVPFPNFAILFLKASISALV